MGTVFFAVGGSIWESAVFVPIACFTVASFRLTWRGVGTCAQWLILGTALCTAFVRVLVVRGVRDPSLSTANVCGGFGGWEWGAFVMLSMWPMMLGMTQVAPSHCMCMPARMCACVYACVRVYVCMSACVYECMRACVCMSACVRVCMNV